MTSTSKEEILEKHLPYEIDMLRQTYRKLEEGQLPDEVIGNALIESFCIHARSLLDFFANRGREDDDFVAAKFTDSFSTRIKRFSAPWEPLYTKLNKEIFHLTGGRKNTEADQFKMSTDGKQLVHELEQEIFRFELCLPANFKAIFRCNTPPVIHSKTFSFKGPVNSTSVVSNMVTVGSLGPARPGQPHR